jgi:hypothetical protein
MASGCYFGLATGRVSQTLVKCWIMRQPISSHIPPRSYLNLHHTVLHRRPRPLPAPLVESRILLNANSLPYRMACSPL